MLAQQEAATARALWSAARAAADQGRWQTSRTLARRALERWSREQPPDELLRARILISLAYAESELGFRDRAADLLVQAAGCPAAAPVVAIAEAMLLLRTGRLEKSLDRFDSAVHLLEHRRDPAGEEDLAVALVNRGLLHMTAGRLRPAAADTRRAAVIGRRLALADLLAIAEHNLGYLLFLSGDLPAALATMAPAGPDDVTADGVALLDRARVLAAAGLLADAAALLDTALRQLRLDGATADQLDAHLLHSDLDLRTRRPDSAARHARRAIVLARRRGNRPAEAIATLALLRAGRAATGRRRKTLLRDAATAADLALELGRVGLSDECVVARLVQAELLLDAGLTGPAAEALAGIEGRPQLLGARLHLRLLHARLAAASGRTTAATGTVRGGLDEIARFQASVGSQDLQAAIPVHGAELAAFGMRLAMDSGSPAQVLQWLERSRGVTTRMPQVRPVPDARLAESLAELRVAWGHARSRTVAGHPDPAVEARVRELRRRVRDIAWAAAGGIGPVERPPTLAAVRRRLRAQNGGCPPAVVAGFRMGTDLWVLVITERRAEVRRWTTVHALATIAARVAADLDLLAGPRIPEPALRQVVRNSLAAGLAALDDMLVRPVADLIGDHDGPLLISGVGTLATVPWLLLPRLRGRPITVNSSVTASLRTAGALGDTRPACVVAVAGPGPAEADAEVRQVAALYPGGTTLCAREATAARLLAVLPGTGLLHVAAHGRHEVESPHFSHLMLADGPWYAYDMAAAGLPRQVVLSACEVGRSNVRVGEPLGLAAALLHAGVATVIAGVSRVADRVANAVMIDYHRRLRAGQAPSPALAGAVAAAPEPAPFSCFGAGS